MRLAAPLAALGALALLAAAPLATQPISRENLAAWAARHAAKRAEARGQAFDLVWLGDSITQQWETPPYRAAWQHFQGGRRVLNLGFTGDATSHLLWRIKHGELDGVRAKAAIVLIGANNLGRLHWPAADDVAGIEAVVDAVRARLPGTPMLLLSVLPSDRGTWVAETSAAINRALAARYGHGAVPGVGFQDVSGLFLRADRSIDTTLYRDQPPSPALHPSPEGMARLAAAIEPSIAEMLGAADPTRPSGPPSP